MWTAQASPPSPTLLRNYSLFPDVWTAVRYTNPRPDDSARPFVNGNTTTITRVEKQKMFLEVTFPDSSTDSGVTAPPDGSAHSATVQALVDHILAPGKGRMGAEVVKLLWEWDSERITDLPRLCIQVGIHPEGWRNCHTKREAGLPAGARPPGDCPLGSLASWSRRQRPTSKRTN